MRQTSLALAAGLLTAAASLSPAAAAEAAATLNNADGEEVGTVELTETPHGTLLHVRIDGLPEGTHAFHVHETGACEPPFQSAGGHFDPDDRAHGLLVDDGPHAGDMPNIHVPASGRLELEVFNPNLELGDALFDDDGAAIVIHEGADDYETDPAGDAGPRIACGVIEE